MSGRGLIEILEISWRYFLRMVCAQRVCRFLPLTAILRSRQEKEARQPQKKEARQPQTKRRATDTKGTAHSKSRRSAAFAIEQAETGATRLAGWGAFGALALAVGVTAVGSLARLLSPRKRGVPVFDRQCATLA